jgi:hypothetical protein
MKSTSYKSTEQFGGLAEGGALSGRIASLPMDIKYVQKSFISPRGTSIVLRGEG